jgi:hypothetical protein
VSLKVLIVRSLAFKLVLCFVITILQDPTHVSNAGGSRTLHLVLLLEILYYLISSKGRASCLILCRTPRPRDNYPHPQLALPRPTLTHDFRMSVTLSPAVSVGKAPFGERRWISFTGGSWSASFGSGTVVVG